MAYELFDAPTAHGPGEFVRLALEAAGVPYIDVTRGPEASQQGSPALQRLLKDRQSPYPAFDAPVLKDEGLVIGQAGAILHHLGPTLKLVARNEQARVWTQQIQFTLGELVADVQATHHPIDVDLPFEDQKTEAVRRADAFCRVRLPRFLLWCEAILARNPAGSRHLVAGKLSYADLTLFQLVEGLKHALPQTTEAALRQTPHVVSLVARVAGLPRVAAYLRSERRLPFDHEGLFPHHPELDRG